MEISRFIAWEGVDGGFELIQLVRRCFSGVGFLGCQPGEATSVKSKGLTVFSIFRNGEHAYAKMIQKRHVATKGGGPCFAPNANVVRLCGGRGFSQWRLSRMS